MKKLLLSLIILSIIPYLHGMNLLTENIHNNKINLVLEKEQGINTEIINVQDKVTVSIQREYFYGTLLKDFNQEGNLNNLYLFNLIKIPININNLPLMYVHLVFLVFVIITFTLVLVFYEETPKEKRNENFNSISQNL